MGWAACGNCCAGSPARAERAVLGVMRPFHSADGHCGVHGGTGDHPECQIRLRLRAWVTQGRLGNRAEVNGVTNQMPWLTVQGSDSEVCPRDPSVSLKGRLQGPMQTGRLWHSRLGSAQGSPFIRIQIVLKSGNHRHSARLDGILIREF